MNAFSADVNSNDGSIAIEQRTIYNDFVDEIRKTLRFYMKNNNQSFFNNFYISGGSALTEGLDDFIANSLNVKVEHFDPFKKITNNANIDNPLSFSIAIGLELRGLNS